MAESPGKSSSVGTMERKQKQKEEQKTLMRRQIELIDTEFDEVSIQKQLVEQMKQNFLERKKTFG